MKMLPGSEKVVFPNPVQVVVLLDHSKGAIEKNPAPTPGLQQLPGHRRTRGSGMHKAGYGLVFSVCLRGPSQQILGLAFEAEGLIAQPPGPQL